VLSNRVEISENFIRILICSDCRDVKHPSIQQLFRYFYRLCIILYLFSFWMRKLYLYSKISSSCFLLKLQLSMFSFPFKIKMLLFILEYQSIGSKYLQLCNNHRCIDSSLFNRIREIVKILSFIISRRRQHITIVVFPNIFIDVYTSLWNSLNFCSQIIRIDDRLMRISLWSLLNDHAVIFWIRLVIQSCFMVLNRRLRVNL